MTEEAQGDGVFIASSSLISKVMQKYFRDVMFKMDVEVVDLQPTPDGYAFNLSFADDDVKIVIKNTIVKGTVDNLPRKLNSKPKKKVFEIEQTESALEDL